MPLTLLLVAYFKPALYHRARSALASTAQASKTMLRAACGKMVAPPRVVWQLVLVGTFLALWFFVLPRAIFISQSIWPQMHAFRTGFRNPRNAEIPKIIHQTYKTSNETQFPLSWQKAVNSWRTMNPNFGHRLWSDEAVRNLVISDYPHLLDVFDSYPNNIQRADLGRYLILHKHGGLYVDVDIECTDHLEKLWASDLVSSGMFLHLTEPLGWSNDFMGAVPRHEFLAHTINHMREANMDYIFPYLTIMASTGPFFLCRMMHSYAYADTIQIMTNEEKDRYMNHLHSSSWHRWDSWLVFLIYNNAAFFKRLLFFAIFIVVALGCRYFYVRRKKNLMGKHFPTLILHHS